MNKTLLSDIATIISSTIVPWHKLEGKTVLISGASGMIGSYLVETLVALNENKFSTQVNIIALCRSHKKAEEKFSQHLAAGKISLVISDVCSFMEYKQHIDYIIHAASPASPDFYGTDPVGVIEANVTGTKNLLQISKQNKTQAFLFISSGEVYGITDPNQDIAESDCGYIDTTNVRSCYAESKRLAENMCVAWHHQYELNTKIIRLFHTYGPSMDLHDSRVFADFVHCIVNNKNIVLNSDGSAKRAFCYISDTAMGIFLVLLKGQAAHAYNLGNPSQEISIIELADKLVKLFPKRHLKIITNHTTTAGYIASPLSRHCPNIEKINQLGWSPSVDIETGFTNTIKSFL